MEYALLIYEDETVYGPEKGGQAMEDIVRRHIAFGQELGGKRRGGAGLKSTATATTLRRAGDACSVHDGPYAESKEQLGGFYLIEAADLDEAIAWARRLPLARDGAIEIRPVLGG